MNTYLKKFIEEKFKKPGVNLEKYFLSKKHPLDLVFSNYVIHKIKDKEQFIKTVFDNLKKDGWFFIHTFDKKDKNSRSILTADSLQKILSKQGFKNIRVRLFNYYDNEEGHKHWHKILEATGKK